MSNAYLEAIHRGWVIFDGAMGTELQKLNLPADAFGGSAWQGLGEALVLHSPDVIEQVHHSYLAVGAQVIETATFRANRVALHEFGLASRLYEINLRAAQIARRAADRFAAETGLPRFVAGSMGPTGQLPSLDDPELSRLSFAELSTVYAEQAEALIAGGVDLLLLETHQDLLEVKAAIQGLTRAIAQAGRPVALQVQVTLDHTGRMLTGPDIEAVVATLSALPVDVIGINCSTGPEEMRESVRRLVALSPRPVSVLPNAGMPCNEDGCTLYKLGPEDFARTLAEFVQMGVRIVGGCCGTGPAHIAALVAAVSSLPLPPTPQWSAQPIPYLASNLSAMNLHQEPRPLLIGERINTQGSKQAREIILAERYDAVTGLAEQQVASGAHVLDVCVALTERADEAETMRKVVKRLSLSAPLPLAFDTTVPEVMQAALETYPGRAILNSVHLEGGEVRARRILELAKTFGAAVIALTIDEQGMARTVERKLEVARRLYHLAVDEIGLPPHALIFDPLTFTLATGDPASADAAHETLRAIPAIKQALPGVLTNLGVSNVSYGLKPPARRVLNSVFLYHAVEAGLDVAIVNPAQITPYADLPAEVRTLADDLIFNRRPDALPRFIAWFAGQDEAAAGPVEAAADPRQQLYAAILRRRREGVEALVEACLQEMSALEILNGVLLPAMKEVGDRFGAGELILPFVLQAAEVMRAAVTHLEPYLPRQAGSSKGTLVLATVFGDVHDIGKNLVKTILVNNGYTVYDLGKQVPVHAIVDKAVEVQADAIGLSALLVATSAQMRLCVEELRRRGLTLPVLVGGAAINPSFAQRIGADYAGGVYYCKDAFDALHVLEERLEPTSGDSAR